MKERTLTPAEQQRKQDFVALSAEMAQKGCTKSDLTTGVVKVNILALLVMLPVAILFMIAYKLFNNGTSLAMDSFQFVLFFVGLIVLKRYTRAFMVSHGAPMRQMGEATLILA